MFFMVRIGWICVWIVREGIILGCSYIGFKLNPYLGKFMSGLVSRFMSGLLVAALLPSCSAQDISKSPFDGERAYGDLVSFLEIGERVPGTEGSLKAQVFIKDGLRNAGVEVCEFPFEVFTPRGMLKMNTIVGVIQGSRSEVIILSNHYDSKYFRDFNFVGANDGGSTTVWMLEMARVLGPRREGYTVWLCFFDGEEAFEKWKIGRAHV
jgi:hypothetical protein